MPPLPKIAPIRLLGRAAPFDDPNYIFELKYDGFRAVAYIEHGTTKLVSSRGITYKRFDDLCAGLASLKVKDAILDGELVCLDDAGVPRFDWLMHRSHPASFVAFDLMWMNGRDYRNKPLLERKTALRRIVPHNSPFVLYADFVIEWGVGLFRAACARDLEGIVGKRKDEPYADKAQWVRVKNPGYSQATGRPDPLSRAPGFELVQRSPRASER